MYDITTKKLVQESIVMIRGISFQIKGIGRDFTIEMSFTSIVSIFSLKLFKIKLEKQKRKEEDSC
jgi:hypothetical protein